MKKVIKILARAITVLIGLLLVALAAVFVVSNRTINQTYVVNPDPIPIPTDIASIKEGERLTAVRGCKGCHSPDLGGDPQFVIGPFANIGAPNLTQGKGGRTVGYTDQDWLRAIQHGVSKDGKGLWIMPSNEFHQLSDGDVGRIIAYLKSTPPVDREADSHDLSLLGRVLLATGQAELIPAAHIPHDQKTSNSIEVAATAAYGGYIATSCSGCHNANYSGGRSPSAAPDAPPSANLTQVVKQYSEAQFLEFFHTGKSTSGRAIPNDLMPWEGFGKSLTETEMKALYAYFKSLPERELGK